MHQRRDAINRVSTAAGGLFKLAEKKFRYATHALQMRASGKYKYRNKHPC